MLGDYPVVWQAADVQKLLQILRSIYRREDIEAIAEDAGLPTYNIRWSLQPALTWRSVYEVAASQKQVATLLDQVVTAQPALELSIDELRSANGNVVADELPSTDTTRRAFDAQGWKNFSPDGRAEAIIVAGQPTFVDVAFLALGMDRARSVCRLAVRFPDEGSGTAFRIGSEHLLTNHHVLYDHQHDDRQATAAEAWFNYEADMQGRTKKVVQIACDVGSIVGERDHDWALIHTAEPIPDDFPPLPISGSEVPNVDDRVYIIQHPYGQPKKVAFQHNLVRAVTDDTIQYWTDTDLGSSGSPVFDERWQVVGLHHFAVPAAGDPTNVRNQGRRIDRVVERMKQLNVYPGD
ncbi:serine protease [Mycolicibacterium cosmeticum]|uniref:trypsin-like serine peptidase n=1 Tax=Mycolicibacterium cosmeticum TaxID=258533 RepID=UPI0032048C82